jgi:hypothetical protein
MLIGSTFIQVIAVLGGFVLGTLTGAWVSAAWQRWHPQTVRFWGTWYTDPRLLIMGGLGLVAAWMGLFFTSNL